MKKLREEIRSAILRSWRTTTIGVALLVIAVWLAIEDKLDAPHIVSLLLAAAGFFTARDAQSR